MDQRVRARRGIRRIDARARGQRGHRQPGRSGIVEHDGDGALLCARQIAGRRIEFESPDAIERRRRANGAPRRRGIQDQAAGDGHRRRIRAEDVPIAAREQGRRLEAQPHEPAV